MQESRSPRVCFHACEKELMRRALDTLYRAALWLSALCLVAIALLVGAQLASRILDGAPSPFPLGSPTRYTSDGTATRYSFSIDDGDDDETPAFCEAPASLGEGRCTDGSRLVMGR